MAKHGNMVPPTLFTVRGSEQHYAYKMSLEREFLDGLEDERSDYRFDAGLSECRELLGLDLGLDGREVCHGEGVLRALPPSMWDREMHTRERHEGYYLLSSEDLELLSKKPNVEPVVAVVAPTPPVVKQVIKETIRSDVGLLDDHGVRSHVRNWLQSRGDDLQYWTDANIDLMMGPLRLLAMKDMFLVTRSLSPRELVRIVNEKGEYTLYSSLVYERVTRYCIRYHGLWESNDFKVLARWIRRLVNCGGLVDAAEIERAYIQATSKPESRTPEARTAEDQLYRYLQRQSQERFQRIYSK